MDYPRVLIFGQPFNKKHGGGITLTNLFKGWPKDKIAVTDTGHMMIDITTDVCDNYYQLGIEEYKWQFPFNLIQKKYFSGQKTFNNEKSFLKEKTKADLRYYIVNNIFYPLMQWLGLFYCVIKIKMSSKFITWLSNFKPELLYIQVTTRESIKFVTELIDYLEIPAAIHFMDDWPATIVQNGLFKTYWKNKIDKELRILLDRVNLHLSISEAMSMEYKRRYDKDFIPFHNPIDADFWLPYTKKDFSIKTGNIKILCSGRVGQNGVSKSLIDIASAIDKMNTSKLKIKFHIQTAIRDNLSIERLSKFQCVVINQFANYDHLPRIFSDADILLIANDFDSQSINYLRYSMPTKASEYMISGTPILVYSSNQTSVYHFFSKHECGYCVSVQSEEEIIKAIKFLIENEEYRKRISEKAVKIAMEKFDAFSVRKQFQSRLINLINSSSNINPSN